MIANLPLSSSQVEAKRVYVPIDDRVLQPIWQVILDQCPVPRSRLLPQPVVISQKIPGDFFRSRKVVVIIVSVGVPYPVAGEIP